MGIDKFIGLAGLYLYVVPSRGDGLWLVKLFRHNEPSTQQDGGSQGEMVLGVNDDGGDDEDDEDDDGSEGWNE